MDKTTNENNEDLSQDVKTPLINKAAQNEKMELGGPEGLEPTRYGDWERNGRCIDF